MDLAKAGKLHGQGRQAGSVETIVVGEKDLHAPDCSNPAAGRCYTDGEDPQRVHVHPGTRLMPAAVRILDLEVDPRILFPGLVDLSRREDGTVPFLLGGDLSFHNERS
ncbi:MAG: hypothetical protein ACE5ID_09895, partial [Acidobacteriota bacterium]